MVLSLFTRLSFSHFNSHFLFSVALFLLQCFFTFINLNFRTNLMINRPLSILNSARYIFYIYNINLFVTAGGISPPSPTTLVTVENCNLVALKNILVIFHSVFLVPSFKSSQMPDYEVIPPPPLSLSLYFFSNFVWFNAWNFEDWRFIWGSGGSNVDSTCCYRFVLFDIY